MQGTHRLVFIANTKGKTRLYTNNAGNLWSGLNASAPLVFTTGDFTPPQISSRSPSPGAVDINVSTGLVIVFNEKVRIGQSESTLSHSPVHTCTYGNLNPATVHAR